MAQEPKDAGQHHGKFLSAAQPIAESWRTLVQTFISTQSRFASRTMFTALRNIVAESLRHFPEGDVAWPGLRQDR
jgi:hypothetical protein